MGHYEFKTTPFEHQLKGFTERRDFTEDAIFWEMGTGKSKLIIDQVAWNYAKGKINGLLVVAPGGVHRNWVVNEIPFHLPDGIQYDAAIWQNSAKKTKRHQQAIDRACFSPHLGVFVMNYEAFATKDGRDAAWKFLRNRKAFHVLDESPRIKSPNAKRSRSIICSGRHSVMRRILTGTPIVNGPFDLYAQFKFLNEKFWAIHELNSFAVFKTHFGIWVKEQRRDGQSYETCVGYSHLDELNVISEDHSTRVLKEDVLDLPPKLYRKHYVEMSPNQKRLYKQVSEETVVFLGLGMINAPLAIVRLLRLQQILCGYVPVEGGEEPVATIDDKNVRIEALMEIIAEAGDQKIIIWARFRKDIELIMERLAKDDLRAVSYYGATSGADRAEALARFTGERVIMDDSRVVDREVVEAADQAQFFVANQATAGEGLTLTCSNISIYYSNSYKLGERLQSEDRPHRIGQDSSVLYVDIVVPDSMDEKIINALRNKWDIASQITGDELRAWL